MIKITEEDFSLDEMIKRARSKDAGAIVTFLGTVRDDGMERMEVEAFREAAQAELEAIREEAMSRFSPYGGGGRAPHRLACCWREHRGHRLLGSTQGGGLFRLQIHN